MNKAAYLAVGIDADGFKDVLGIWIDATEGAKFWMLDLQQAEKTAASTT